MIKTLIFDFDGTIANTKAFAYELYKKITEEHGVKQLSETEFDHLKTLSLMDKFRAHDISFLRLPKIARVIRRTVATVMDQVKPYEGMVELLNLLHNKGYLIFIVSSNSENNINVFLNKYDIDYIEKVYGRAKYLKKEKVLKKLFKTYKLEKNETLYIGDETRDIVSCKKIDLPIASVTWGFDTFEQLNQHEPDYIAKTSKNLENYIFKHK